MQVHGGCMAGAMHTINPPEIMRSKNITVRTPHRLLDALTSRAEALGYETLTAYFLGLARYDLMVQGEHVLTEPWSHLSLSKQDAIDERLAALTEQGKGERGQLLARLIERAKTPDSTGIADALQALDHERR